MLTEAYRAGFYETEYGRHFRIQILTAEDLLNGKRADIPLVDASAIPKARAHQPAQTKLLV